MAIPVGNKCPTCKQEVQIPSAYDLMMTIIMALKNNTNLMDIDDYKFSTYNHPTTLMTFTYMGSKYTVTTRKD